MDFLFLLVGLFLGWGLRWVWEGLTKKTSIEEKPAAAESRDDYWGFVGRCLYYQDDGGQGFCDHCGNDMQTHEETWAIVEKREKTIAAIAVAMGQNSFTFRSTPEEVWRAVGRPEEFSAEVAARVAALRAGNI